MQAARKRAPKSLNAAVGPWNSSSRPALAQGSGVTGAGKVNASAQISGNASRNGSPAKKGSSMAAASSASGASGSSASGDTWGMRSGTYKPPSGARPAAMAGPSVTGAALSRVLVYFMVGGRVS